MGCFFLKTMVCTLLFWARFGKKTPNSRVTIAPRGATTVPNRSRTQNKHSQVSCENSPKFSFRPFYPPYGPYSAQRVQKSEICSKPKIIVYSQYCTLGRGDFGGKTQKKIFFWGFYCNFNFCNFLIAPIS